MPYKSKEVGEANRRAKYHKDKDQAAKGAGLAKEGGDCWAECEMECTPQMTESTGTRNE